MKIAKMLPMMALAGVSFLVSSCCKQGNPVDGGNVESIVASGEGGSDEPILFESVSNYVGLQEPITLTSTLTPISWVSGSGPDGLWFLESPTRLLPFDADATPSTPDKQFYYPEFYFTNDTQATVNVTVELWLVLGAQETSVRSWTIPVPGESAGHFWRRGYSYVVNPDAYMIVKIAGNGASVDSQSLVQFGANLL